MSEPWGTRALQPAVEDCAQGPQRNPITTGLLDSLEKSWQRPKALDCLEVVEQGVGVCLGAEEVDDVGMCVRGLDMRPPVWRGRRRWWRMRTQRRKCSRR